MITDRGPRTRVLLVDFLKSDQNRRLSLPQDSRIRIFAKSIESSLETGRSLPFVEPVPNF